MKKRSLLDSFAILAWIQNEKGAQKVEDLLYRAQDGREHVLLNIINLGEIYYRCARIRDLSFAKDILEKMKLLPIKIYPCPNDLVLAAAEIKAQYPMGYADAFVVATAIRENARVVTGDPEFKTLAHLIEIDWLS
ncbi:MAG: type II toxin-antitoxin system VapC family toxin [Thermodesulfobacteriota bacterium]|nr:type II toxin-antitoxin system VapC family toxin [Thermodesulfobacteriota bacterium]